MDDIHLLIFTSIPPYKNVNNLAPVSPDPNDYTGKMNQIKLGVLNALLETLLSRGLGNEKQIGAN
jgi:hypothetical protein